GATARCASSCRRHRTSSVGRCTSRRSRSGRAGPGRRSPTSCGAASDPETLAPPATLPVLWADGDLVVVDKPARLLVVEAPGRSGPTAVDLVGRQLGSRVHAVHRLDEDTTGVLVLARTPEAKAALEATFRTHAA